MAAYGTPSGNSIQLAQIGLYDSSAPGAINAQSVGVSVFPTHIDLQWQGVTDGTKGIGLMTYYLYRDGGYLGATTKPIYSDEAVAASQGAHVYSIYSVDQHFNFATGAILAPLTAAPAGTSEARRIGVRPTGSYWGAAGEQIDLCDLTHNFAVWQGYVSNSQPSSRIERSIS